MNIIQGSTVGQEMCAGDCGRVAVNKRYCGVCGSFRFAPIMDNEKIRTQEARRIMFWTIGSNVYIGALALGLLLSGFFLLREFTKETKSALGYLISMLVIISLSWFVSEWWGRSKRVGS